MKIVGNKTPKRACNKKFKKFEEQAVLDNFPDRTQQELIIILQIYDDMGVQY